MLKVDGEVVPDGVGQLTQGVQHNRVHQHRHLCPVRRIDAEHRMSGSLRQQPHKSIDPFSSIEEPVRFWLVPALGSDSGRKCNFFEVCKTLQNKPLVQQHFVQTRLIKAKDKKTIFKIVLFEVC